MGEVSLCKDMVTPGWCFAAVYSGGFDLSFAVFQPKGIKAAVRGKPYALWQVLIFQEIHPTSHPLREFYIKMA